MSANEQACEKKTNIGRVCFYIICGLIALFLATVLFFIIMTRSINDIPTIFGYGFCINTTESTDGTIKKDSLLMVKPINSSSLKVGDIITYTAGYDELKNIIVKSNTIIQIYKENDKSLFVTNDQESEKIDQNQVIGKYEYSMPTLGRISLFIKTPTGLIVCVALPLFLLLICEIINLIKVSKAQKQEDMELENDLPSYMRITEQEEPKNNFSNKLLDEDDDSILSNDFLFEQQDEELELVESKSPFTSLSYKKPTITEKQANKSSIYSTKEFRVSLNQINKEENKNADNQTDDIKTDIKATDFCANINPDKASDFDIEGISVKVKPDVVNLSVANNEKNHDISITVTNEYTNVIFNSDKHEVNFAFLVDETDKEKKVIIQKKTKI